jgi:serine/threonine protein kinase
MRTGDSVRDGQGNAYQVGQVLGRGLWGKSFLARRESNDQLFVLKVPLAPEDLKGEGGAPESFFAASRDALMEQARLYEQGQLPMLPRLEARFTTPDGQPAILLPRLGDSLERRFLAGLPVGALIDILLAVAREVRRIPANGPSGAGVHGGLRPQNILFAERGELLLTDVATPAVRKHVEALSHLLPGGNPWLPPEIVGAATEVPWSASVDTWALAMILWRGVVGPEAPIAWPARGLDKGAVGAVKDRLIDRMKTEDSNPRFHGRLAERFGVLLSRALSLEVAPSPPFRFQRLDEFEQRLEELAALVRPQVTNVGKVLHERPPARPWFNTDEAVSFSVTVGATAGVEGRDEIGVGIAVFDLAKDERVKNLDLGYTADKHASGRYRFAFRISGLTPGPYRARVAFAIRDSGQPPATAESEFEVRAAPGWVPPAEPPATGQPLQFQREPTGVTSPHLDPPAADVTPRAGTPMPPVGSTARSSGRLATTPAASAAPAPPPWPVAAVDGPSRTESGDTLVPQLASHLDPEPTPLRAPRPLPPTGADPAPPPAPFQAPAPPAPPAPIASPLPPAPAAMGGPSGGADEPVFEPPRNWTYEPIPRARTAAPPAAEEDPPSQVDLDDDGEPGPVQRMLEHAKNDPFVLVMLSLGGLILVLLAVYLSIRS